MAVNVAKWSFNLCFFLFQLCLSVEKHLCIKAQRNAAVNLECFPSKSITFRPVSEAGADAAAESVVCRLGKKNWHSSRRCANTPAWLWKGQGEKIFLNSISSAILPLIDSELIGRTRKLRGLFGICHLASPVVFWHYMSKVEGGGSKRKTWKKKQNLMIIQSVTPRQAVEERWQMEILLLFLIKINVFISLSSL